MMNDYDSEDDDYNDIWEMLFEVIADKYFDIVKTYYTDMRILTEEENVKDLSPVISKLLDRLITVNYDEICKIEVTAPWDREVLQGQNNYQHYKVLVYFIGGYGTDRWPMNQAFRGNEEKIMNEVWDAVYNFTGKPCDLYSKTVRKCIKD